MHIHYIYGQIHHKYVHMHASAYVYTELYVWQSTVAASGELLRLDRDSDSGSDHIAEAYSASPSRTLAASKPSSCQ